MKQPTTMLLWVVFFVSKSFIFGNASRGSGPESSRAMVFGWGLFNQYGPRV
jgi:hypothetical protein